MIRIEMPIDDFTFIKQHYDNMDRYLVRVEYSHQRVSFEIPKNKFDDFLLDYRSMIARKGTDGKERYSDEGVRMNRILNAYIANDPLLQ